MTGYAVKALDNTGAIEAYAVRWGNPSEPDRSKERDFFTPQTDLMLDEWGWPRPIPLEHMVTVAGQRAGSVGQWNGATKDSIGVKLRGQLKTSHPMYPQLARDIKAGQYYLSSDSAPQFVKRRPLVNGTNHLDRWGFLTASLTKSPAEHRLLPVEMIKALALKAGARHSGADAADMQLLHDVAVRQGATCAPPAKMVNPRAARIERELKALEFDVADTIDMQLYDLEWQMRLEKELAQIERGY